MFNFRDRKDLLVLLIIGVLVATAIMIISLIVIWSPKKEKFEVGNYSINISISDEYKVQQYVDKISNLLVLEDYETLYNLLSKDYVQVYEYDINKFKEKCKELKICGQKLLLQDFKIEDMKKFNKLYFITAYSYDDESLVNLVIRENSPMQFTFSFDNFVTRNVYLTSKKNENISLQILEETYTTSEVKYNLKITNKNKEKIYINSNNMPNEFLLSYNDGSFVEGRNSEVNNNPIELLPDEIRDFNVTFNIEGTNWNGIFGIVLRDVKLSSNKVLNIEFRK